MNDLATKDDLDRQETRLVNRMFLIGMALTALNIAAMTLLTRL